MHRILIAEDEVAMRNLLVKALQKAGFQAVAAADGAEALALHRAQPADLMVLDLMMPVMTGFEVLKALRPQDEVPVLMLTAQGQGPTRLEGFTLGADDYLLKPFSSQELVARIKAVLRRTQRFKEVQVIHSGPFTLDLGSKTLLRDGSPVRLSSAEFHVLKVLMSHAGQSLSRLELLNLAWPPNSRPSPRTVDVHIVNLRRKIMQEEDPKWIVSERVRGFCWTCSAQSVDAV